MLKMPKQYLKWEVVPHQPVEAEKPRSITFFTAEIFFRSIQENFCLYSAEIFKAAKFVALKSVLQKYVEKFFTVSV